MALVKRLMDYILLVLTLYIGVTLSEPREEIHKVTTHTKWEAQALRELLTDKSSMLSCPTREYRDDNPEEINPFVRKDGSEITSLLLMTPPKFLANYKNPCWYECLNTATPYEANSYRDHGDLNFNHTFHMMEGIWEERLSHGSNWRLRCLPYFYIVGQPKCGTTDMFYKLSLHPDILMGPMKEPQWWTRRRMYKVEQPGPQNQIASFTDYIDIFDKAAENIRTHMVTLEGENVPRHARIIGDGTTSTFWENFQWIYEVENQGLEEPSHLILHYIAHAQPDAKFILNLRNPTERQYSSYNYFTREEKSPAHFHDKVVERIQTLTNCANERGWRFCVYDHHLRQFPPFDMEAGLYSVFLEDWLQVFKLEQFKVVRSEDFRSETRRTLLQVFRFLDVEPLRHEELEAIAASHTYVQKQATDEHPEPMLEETKQLLDDFYRPFNEKLAEILGDDAFLWRD